MRTLISSTLPLLLLTFGCAHQKPVARSGPTADSRQAQVAASAPAEARGAATGSGVSCTSDTNCEAGLVCVEGTCVSIADHLDACVKQRLHFAFDSSLIDASELPSLQRAARCLGVDHAMHLTIEGDADERGTEEYNMALGDRRAVEVAKYLKDLGVSEAQLRTVSYGKEKPVCTDHDERCWSQNRRADLHVAAPGAGTRLRR